MSDLTPEYLEQLGKEYLRNAAELERLQTIQDGIKAQFERAHDAGIFDKRGTFGHIQATYRAGARRLDTKRLEATYPVGKFPALYEPKLSTTAVKSAFAPNELAQFQTEGAGSVIIKPSEA